MGHGGLSQSVMFGCRIPGSLCGSHNLFGSNVKGLLFRVQKALRLLKDGGPLWAG